MELSGNELNQIDETEWIERRKHELILRKYRQNTQRLFKEFQLKIQLLTKEVKRQQFIIDTFANKSIETLDSHEPQPQTVADSSTKIVEILEPDSEPTTIIYLDGLDVDSFNSGYQCIEVDSDSVQPKSFQMKPKIDKNHKIEKTHNNPSSLVSIQIQPNLRDSTNVYVCDECNKIMSSRRVLAVCIHNI